MKDTIFISHANPENNYFAIWLASKLKFLGYKVWADIKDIKPGQYFNRDFEKVIREETIRFLAVVSKEYIIKSKRDDTGVMNEILCARTIKEIDGFIIPLRYDQSDYEEFTVGLRGRQSVLFNDNWATGLRDLLKYFEELDIPKGQHENNSIHFWHEAQKIQSEPIEKLEKYFTNWFPTNLPELIYIHQPEVFTESDFILLPYNYVREGDRLITFVTKETIQGYTRLRSSYQIQTTDLIKSTTITIDTTFQLIEPNKKLVKLLNKIFLRFLIKKEMKCYEQSGRKNIFYFPYSQENAKMVNLKQIGKTRRTVLGKTLNYKWYFALSHSASLYPMSCFRIVYHLVFTDINGKLLDVEDQHELRRSFPNDWYNRKWFETMLAMMVKISNFDIDNLIKIQVDLNSLLTINVLPIDITSSIGYNEPTNEIETGIL